jgi:hypothetical protein
VVGLLLRHIDLDRRNQPTADERTKMQQPLFAEQADVDVDAIQRTER